ncbi:MAG: alpha-2-macroglobulin family protein [Pseudomonadales bacterium]|nr:alpha-2-macroglobulin family protein [Pseudomonadales bacterium]
MRGVMLMLVAMLFLLGGCGGAANDPAEPAEDAAPAPAATIDGFGLVSAGHGTYDGRASIVLTFSRPLAGAQKFDELLTLNDADGGIPQGSWVLEDDGTAIRFPYVESNRDYRLTVHAALAATDGSTIGSDLSRDVHTGPLQPVLGFASQGSVLPMHETRGLPIVTVNVGEVDVEFLKVRDRDLSKFLDDFSRGGRRSYWSLAQMAGYADAAYAARFAVSGKPNERSVSYLPVRDIDELAAPGLYFAVMKQAGTFAYEQDTSLFLVTDIGLHLRVYPQSLVVHAASLESGRAKAGVRLSIRDPKGIVVATAETDGDGMATFDGYALNGQHLMLARDGEDLAVMPFNQPALDLSEFAVTGRREQPAEIFPWASRDLYRPGEHVRVSALLRDHDGRVLPAQPVFATLHQPDGRALARTRLDAGDLGYYEFGRDLPEDAATGRWSVSFSTDPEAEASDQAFAFRVEEFLPERMTLELASAVEALHPGESLPLNVTAAYLHGAPAAGNRFSARLALVREPHPVAAFADYWFGDARMELPATPDDVVDARLDAGGRLAVPVTVLDGVTVTAPVRITVGGSVYETGGRAVSRSLKRTLWPADELVGIRPLFDMADGAAPGDRAEFEVIRTNAAGDLLAAAGLAVKVIREVRDYQWQFEEGAGWRFDYVTRDETVHEETMTIAAGARGHLAVPVEWGGYRVEIRDPSSGLLLRQPFDAGWGGDGPGSEARPDKVRVVLDKPAYAAGEQVTATITPPHAGPALVLLESDHLLWSQTLDVAAGTRVSVPLDAAWNRHDLYLTVLVFRPGSSADAITPNRAVGIAHVPLARADRALTAQLSAPADMRPGNALELTLRVPELAGKQAAVRVTATDAGVLNITRFGVPDAAAWFFARRRLGVDAYDVYGRVIESFAGVQARLRYGGDAELTGLPQARRPDAEVNIVDLASAPVMLDADGMAHVSLPVPDFNGTLRVRALVYGEAGYANAEADTLVRAPVVLQGSLPRVLAPGDVSRLTLDIDNASGGDDRYTLTLTSDGPVRLAQAAAEVSVPDNAHASLAIPLTAADGFGTAHVHVRLVGRSVTSERTFAVVVRPAWPAVQRLTIASQAGNAPVRADASLTEGLFPDSVVQRLTIGRLPPLPYAQAALDLLRYPYGCAEQTVSKALPLVLLDETTRARFGVAAESIRDFRGQPLDVSLAGRASLLDKAFARLSSMQNGAGHFALWPGDFDADTSLTPYVTEMALLAKEAGFTVPSLLLDRALERLQADLLKGGNTDYGYEQYEHRRLAEMAHAGYVLAKVGKAPLGTLRALFDNERGKLLTPLPLAQLGVALALQGDRERADAALKEVSERQWQRPAWLGDYGSDLRDAVLIAALVHENELRNDAIDTAAFAAARQLLGEQGNARTSAYWLSTQEAIAVVRLGRALASAGDGFTVQGLAQGSARPSIAYFSHTLTPVEQRGGLTLTPTAAGSLFVTQEVAGVPRRAPVLSREDMKIERAWYRANGSPWQGEPLREGDVLVAVLTVSGRQTMADALVVDLTPGGLEVENLNLTDRAPWADVTVDDVRLTDVIGDSGARFEEYRDDRYVAALTLYEGSSTRLYYLLRAVTPGTYVIPPPSLEDMYRPALRVLGAVDRQQVTITPP